MEDKDPFIYISNTAVADVLVTQWAGLSHHDIDPFIPEYFMLRLYTAIASILHMGYFTLEANRSLTETHLNSVMV